MKRLLLMIASLGLASTLISPLTAQSKMIPQSDLAESLDSYYNKRTIARDNREANRSNRRGVRSWLRSLIESERRDGGRDLFADLYFSEQLCAVSPNGVSVGSWSSQPLFIWRDQSNIIQRVEVYQEGSRDLVWSAAVGTGTEDGWYVIDPAKSNPSLTLDVGVTYYFALRQSGEEGFPSGTEKIPFEILSEEDRTSVTTALEAAGVTYSEYSWEALEVFAEQSNYGGDEGERPYFLDVARVLFSMPSSPERDGYINEIVNTYCQPLPDNMGSLPHR